MTPKVSSIQLWQVYGDKIVIESANINIPVNMIICPFGLDKVITINPKTGIVASCDTPLSIPLTKILILSCPNSKAGAYNWNIIQKNRQLTLIISGLTDAYLNKSINQNVYFYFFFKLFL